jgi:hypothetical protein
MTGVLGGLIGSYRNPIVTGGTLASDATYYYRVFASNGTFSVTNSYLSCDILTVAGGGGPGGIALQTDPSGPGGAGSVISVSNELISAGTSWAIVIGGGGAGGGTTTNGTNGTNTTVNGTTIIATGGGGGARSSSSFIANAGNNGGSGGGGSASNTTGVNGAGGTASAGSTSGLNGTVTTRAFAGGSGLGRATASQRSSGGGGGSGGAGANATLQAITNNAVPGNGGVGTSVFSSWLSACVSAISNWQVINATASGAGVSQTITTDSTNLFTGMLVTGGTNINPGSTIIAVPNGTSITIDRFNSGAVSGPLTFTLRDIAGGGPGIAYGGPTGSSRGGTKRTNVSSLVNSGAGTFGARVNSTANGGSGVVIIRYLRSAVGG